MFNLLFLSVVCYLTRIRFIEAFNLSPKQQLHKTNYHISAQLSPTQLSSSSIEEEQTTTTTSFDDIESYKDTNPSAGADGYSILRRPVTFDSDVDPTFDTPKNLDESIEDETNDVNKLWFDEKKTTTTTNNLNDITLEQTVFDSTSSLSGSNQQQQRQAEESQSLNIYKRTYTTLDYPLVIKALANECDSIYGQDLVLNSILVSTSSHESGDVGGGSRSSSSSVGSSDSKGMESNDKREEENDILTMPLTATSLQGVHHRYGAVNEMQLLMEGRITGFITPKRRSSLSTNNKGGGKNNSQGKKKKVQKLPLNRPPITGLAFDIQPILSIIDEGKVLENQDILDITNILEVSLDVLDWCDALYEVNDEQFVNEEDGKEQDTFVELPKLCQSINVDSELINLLSNAFDDNGKLDGLTFPTIGKLRSKVRTYKRDIVSSIDSILAMPSMKSKLAVESGGALTMEINGRLVIPVQQTYQNSVGIVHDASRSGKTCYVEPTEIVGPTNELRQAEAELRSEEARVWRQLTELIITHRTEIERNVASLGQLDVVMARVKLGRKLGGGVIPTVKDEGVVNVKDARHPILLLRGLDNVVGSDVTLGEDKNQGLILTGPNSGGKTIILKELGLYALMVRDGIPIPSKKPARVDFFSPVLADIGDLQSVDGDLSTFSGHMLVCREVLNNADKNALVLMDELGSGTDPNQGVAIARALLEALLDRGCRVAITTHYLELKVLSSTDDRFAVAGMQFVNGKPTYRLLPGVIGESFAIAVAERLQLPESVINRANELLDSDTRVMGELMRDLEDQKLVVDEKASELQKREYEILELKADMKKQQEKLQAKQLNARREEAKKFAAKLEAKERLLEDILEKLKGSGASKKVVADSWTDIRIVKREVMSDAENVPGVVSRMNQQQVEDVELIPISEMKGINKVNVDDKVIVCKKGAFYNKEGIVKQVGKKIQVAVGNVPVRLTTKDIAFPPSSGRAQQPSSAKEGGPKISKMAQRALELDSTADSPVDMSSSPTSRDKGTQMKTKSNTVDCLGLNFEESKRKCITAFSGAVMQNRSVVYILHGHGTGVLKKKIRSWLQTDRQWVKKYSAADQADGGDALTKVELKKQNLF